MAIKASKVMLCRTGALNVIPPTHLAQLFHSVFYLNEAANNCESQQMDG